MTPDQQSNSVPTEETERVATSTDAAAPSASQRRNNSWSKFCGKIGIALVLMSGVFFFSMFSVPWWPLEAGGKVVAGGALYAGVQASWWCGAALMGPAAMATLKGKWLRRRPVA